MNLNDGIPALGFLIGHGKARVLASRFGKFLVGEKIPSRHLTNQRVVVEIRGGI